MPSLTIVNYLVERNNRWRNLRKTFEFFEFLGILGWIVNIDNLDSRIAIYKRRGLTKLLNWNLVQTICTFGIRLYHCFIRNSGTTEFPRSRVSQVVPHSFSWFGEFWKLRWSRELEVPKLSSFRRIHAIEDESIEERLEYRTIRSMEYILFYVETADMSWT